MTSRTFNIPRSKDPSRVSKILDAIDVAAKYFVYKLYDATRGAEAEYAAISEMDKSIVNFITPSYSATLATLRVAADLWKDVP